MEPLFQVLAEPNRRAILQVLVHGERSVGDLQRRLRRLTQPALSKHLRVLRDSGLVEVRVAAQKRMYSLRPEPLMALDAWLEPYRKFWTERFDALERHLETMPDDTPKKKKRKGKGR
jgi:DNA-binding transcriptional ArsR family regulator